MRGSGQTLQRDIRTVESIRWSWLKALKGSALFGAGFGILGTLVTVAATFAIGMRDILSVAVIFCLGLLNWVLYFAMLAFPFSGLTSRAVEGKLVPNQGIKLSVRNAWRTGLRVSLMLGAMFGVAIAFVMVLATGYLMLTGEAPLDLNTLLTSSLLIIMVLGAFVIGFVVGVGPMAAAWYGGFDAIYHYSLRYRLEKEGLIPEHYERFLDFAAERIFLRKVGGGYIFVHRLLMEHFAKLAK
jgi:hypothetical protein